MNQVVTIPKPDELNEFINFLFDGLEGYMYVIAKVPDDADSWDQVFYEYPSQVPVAIKAIEKYSSEHEIYIAPVLYKSKRAVKETFKVSQVLWCDFDGNFPENLDIPPSWNNRTSEEGHNHVYWKLDQPITNSDTIEEYNRRLCFKYDSDMSGWDITQVLRPPYTVNHKRGGLNVYTQASASDLQFNLAVFDELAPAPEKSVDYALWEKMDLPDISDVIYSNKFGPEFRNLFEKQAAQVEDRSASLTNMAYTCAEAGLNDREIYVIISHLATRWEKFKHHTSSSRARQLIGIIEHVRIKHPHSNYDALDQIFEYSPKTLLETDIEVEWAIPDMLMANGVMLFAGPSGLGKSQIAMQFMAHMSCGKSFLGYEFPRPQRVGFFSLEMGDFEVKHFLQDMYPQWRKVFTAEEIDLMNQNWTILPFGEALGLNTTHGQAVFLKYLDDYKWDGVFIDSVGSAIFGNISSSEVVQSFTNFNDKVRKRYGCFLWYIHHFRKPAPGTKSYGGIEDSFGDQYLTARATSVYTLVRKGENLKLRNPKNRHAKEQPDIELRRTEGLYFENLGESVETEPDNLLAQIVEEKPKPKGDMSPKPFT